MIELFEKIIRDSELNKFHNIELVKSANGSKIEAFISTGDTDFDFSFSITLYCDGNCDFLILNNTTEKPYFSENIVLDKSNMQNRIEAFLAKYKELIYN